MTRSSTRWAFVPTKDLLPPSPIARPLTFGGIAALLGAAVWGLLAHSAHVESGWVAWGIGALVGFAFVKAGGYGMLLSICAGALALLSIGSGKHLAFQLLANQAATEITSNLTAEELAARQRAAPSWVALGDQPTDAQVRAWAKEQGIRIESARAFREEESQELHWLDAHKPTLDEWREHVREEITSVSFVDHLQEDFHPLDILFAILGIATAFGLVSRRTTEMQVAARQAIREQHKAEAEAEAAANAGDGEGENPPATT
jgi:hypothetical protein